MVTPSTHPRGTRALSGTIVSTPVNVPGRDIRPWPLPRVDDPGLVGPPDWPRARGRRGRARPCRPRRRRGSHSRGAGERDSLGARLREERDRLCRPVDRGRLDDLDRVRLADARDERPHPERDRDDTRDGCERGERPRRRGGARPAARSGRRPARARLSAPRRRPPTAPSTLPFEVDGGSKRAGTGTAEASTRPRLAARPVGPVRAPAPGPPLRPPTDARVITSGWERGEPGVPSTP